MEVIIGYIFILFGILNLYTVDFVIWDTVINFAIGYLLLENYRNKN